MTEELGPASPSSMCIDSQFDLVTAKPADLVKCSPELTGLVYIDLASLLSVGFPESLAFLKCFTPRDEDATLAAQICSTGQT